MGKENLFGRCPHEKSLNLPIVKVMVVVALGWSESKDVRKIVMCIPVMIVHCVIKLNSPTIAKIIFLI